MSILDSLGVALFCITLVFSVLAILFTLVILLSKGLNLFNVRRSEAPTGSVEASAVAVGERKNDEAAFSTGELKLFNVDEKTAAMIMAIVSHESQIPLSELIFKSIKAVE